MTANWLSSFVAPAWRKRGIAAIALYDKVAEQVALRSYVIRLDAARSM